MKNVAASVRARLLTLAKERKEDFQFLLPVVEALRAATELDQEWRPGGPAWRERDVV